MLHNLDFFSSSPKNFIFQKSSNKTNFGGFCFILYIFIIIIIIIYYIIDFFFLTEKYSIEYSLTYKTTTFKEINELNSKNEYNPTLNFSLSLYKNDLNMTELSERFLLINPVSTQMSWST